MERQRLPLEELSARQDLPLEDKTSIAKMLITEWYEYFDGQVYVSFSGGKDSTVLLHIVRSLYPDVPAVFCNTGIEYPEIVKFVRSVKNVIWLRPNHTFKTVVERFGYPVISKRVATAINRYQRTKNPEIKKLRLHGGINPTSGKKEKIGVIPKKWAYLIKADFPISEYCCEVMKKGPFRKYGNATGRKGMTGLMASDSGPRKVYHLKHGCNAFDLKKPLSMPLAIWKEQDVWEYLKEFDVPYSKIYDMGYTRTGCFACGFGCHMEEQATGSNRFQKMAETHPKLWWHCMDKLNMAEILEFCGVSIY